MGVVLLQDAVDGVDLAVHLIGGDGVGRVDEHQLPLTALEHFGDAPGQEVRRDIRTQQAVQTQHGGHAVQLLDAPGHGLGILGRQIGVAEDHVGGGHVEVLLQLLLGRQELHILSIHALHVITGEDLGEIVIHRRVEIADGGRDQDHGEGHQEGPEVAGDPGGHTAHVGDQGLVHGGRQRFIQQ